jgi:hypothetical protein
MGGRHGSTLSAAITTSVALILQVVATSAATPQFVPGQEWSNKSALPTTAKVIIGRVEPFGDRVCISVSIVDIPIPPGAPGAGGVTQIAHIPFDESVLAASVDQLFATGVSPAASFKIGYKQWKDAKGGIFTISVEKAIRTMFQTVNRK